MKIFILATVAMIALLLAFFSWDRPITVDIMNDSSSTLDTVSIRFHTFNRTITQVKPNTTVTFEISLDSAACPVGRWNVGVVAAKVMVKGKELKGKSGCIYDDWTDDWQDRYSLKISPQDTILLTDYLTQ